MFIFSKIAGVLADSFTVFFLAVLGGCLLCLNRRRRALGRRVLSFSFTVALVLSVLPLDVWGLARLEDRFPRPAALPDHVDGIVVLGGGLSPAVTAARHAVSFNSAAARMTAVVGLSRRYPQARVVFSGGAGDPLNQLDKEADHIHDFYREIGFDPSRIELEGQSRNTRENALFSQRLVHPRKGEVWLLVTSAAHMPRAVGCFRAAGWPVLAWPVDYHTTGKSPSWADLRFSLSAGLGGMRNVLHELAGLVAYRLLGWTDALFPQP